MADKEIIDKLTSLKGIGKAKAEALVEEGFNTVSKIQQASIEELIAVNGISEQIATSIQTQLASEPKAKTAEEKQEKTKKEPSTAAKKETTKKPSAPKKKSKEEPTDSKKEPVEPVEDETASVYEVKKKATLSDELKQQLQIREQIKQRTPTFLREEWFRYKRIPKNWRRPDGLHSKMRINLKYRQNRVRVGFRGPKTVRGLHPSGFEEIMVYNVKDLESIDPGRQAARIGGSVGTKKRMAIEEKAKELEIRLLNKRRE